ncbi:MAG TPA: hypothetical protein VJ937_14000 [Salinivirga sp.]|uniref:hypothetical protein n=1 Tax=Salinivirga sp. TaxID=1970192 RepID=UPI002B4A7C60|nr:hypothetical protein [Salinivirga sp.]HKK60588.1 hypothetical protein [Salinivirga sp.]
MKKLIIILAAIAIVFFGCDSGKNKKENFGEILGDDPKLDSTQVSEELPTEAQQVLQNISSSPVEMAALLQSAGVEFSERYIAEVKDVDRYNTDFKRAVNLGILGADLGYLNMYKKTGPVMNNMQAIRKLSEELRVQQFFDFQTIKRLATNNENIDSLMYITLQSFNNMDTYLQQNGRSEISALIICGTWMEGMYIATQVLKEAQTPNPEIVERIGDQKEVIENLTTMLSYYKNNPQFKTLHDSYARILSAYDGVTKTIEQGEPEQREIDGIMVVVQNEISHVEVPDETLETIILTIEEVRNNLIRL